MEKLPSEVIFNIFTFLDLKQIITCSKVSRFWNNLISELSLWKILNFRTIKTQNINTAITQLISIHGSKALSLSLSIYQSEKLTNETLTQILTLCPNLTRLDIGGFWGYLNNIINDSTLMAIPDCLPNLTELNISRIETVNGNIVSKIVEKCTKLQRINLSETNMVLGDWETGFLISIGEHLPNIRYYNAFNAISTSHRKSISLSIATHCKYLEQFYADNVYPEVIQALITNCPNITRLYIPGAKITDLQIALIANTYSNLELFCVSSNGVVTDAAIITLALKCPKLEYVRISWCLKTTNKSILELVKNCKNLRYLSLENLPTINDTTMEEIIKYCDHLLFLEVSTCKHCTQITGDIVAKRFLDNRYLYTERLLSEYFNGDKVHWDNIRDEVKRAIVEKDYRVNRSISEDSDEQNFFPVIVRTKNIVSIYVPLYRVYNKLLISFFIM